MNNLLINSFDYRSNFSKIVEVFVSHEYYSNKKCNSIEIIPELESSLLIRNYDLLFKPTSQGFIILQNLNSKNSSVVFSGPVSFSFKMIFKDLLFLNLTDIPFKYNQSFLFSNKSSEEGNLHENTFVGKNDIQSSSKNGLSGLINLTLNKKNEFFGNENKNNIPKTLKYTIKYDSRNFILRYNFYFSSSANNIQNYYVLNEKTSSRYLEFTKRQLENGKIVYSLEIPDSYKLMDRYGFLFYLKKDDEFDKSFSKFLPHPEPKNLSFDSTRNIFINDLFVTLD
tara:strand:- start:185 stop:1030 length:846 start_codon:yes stop_codon:yes gene_type:complete